MVLSWSSLTEELLYVLVNVRVLVHDLNSEAFHLIPQSENSVY